MRKPFLAVALSTILAFSSVAVYSTTALAASKYQIKEDAAVADTLKAYNDLKALFTDKPVYADIQKLYAEKLLPDVKRVEKVIQADDPKISENIQLILDVSSQGNLSAAQAKSSVDIGLQWYFYFFIRDQMTNQVRPALTKGDITGAAAAFDKAVQIYEGGLEHAVALRDKKYGFDMMGSMKTIIEKIQKDIQDNNLNDFNFDRQILDKTLIKVYMTATLQSAEEVSTTAGAAQALAVTEGYFNFMPVYTYLRGGGVVEANFVKEAFASGDASQIKFEDIKHALHAMMIGKVAEYVKQGIAYTEAGDLQRARGYAAEGTMFLVGQQVFFTKEQYAALEELMNKYVKAIDSSDAAATNRLGVQILKSQVAIEGTGLKIGDTAYQVDGIGYTAENAPFINPESSRTLVPVRPIAQAIQAEVEWVDETKTVNITKDGKTTSIAVGSDQVVQDGAVNDKVKLDQPVEIVNGSSFIPLRAVAELFGKRVFYDNGDILILR
jgi:hypothetical protein